jgi:aspartyl-tRNA(Asn)/glutamyl-tRNA(Gln) amidotransferase subunit A
MLSSCLTIQQASCSIRAEKLSPVELTKECLDLIDRLNPSVNAFITITAESALEEARRAEVEVRAGRYRGPLHGIPLALKDIVDTSGVRTTAASHLFEKRVPAQDAFIVKRLRSAGAVLLGKLNLHEFAYGGSGIIGAFGIARNPWDLERITGGSSSGSAAAVAAGLCLGAIGTDTAGSIRLPSAFCGISGFKPTFGLVSAHGVIPLAISYDHVGPMAKTAEDCALLLDAIAAYDSWDPNSSTVQSGGYAQALADKAEKLRLGILDEFFLDDLDPQVAAAFDEAIQTARSIASEIKSVSIPVDTDRTVHVYEAYEYHAKYLPGSADKYQPETLRRIMAGETVTAQDHQVKKAALLELRRNAVRIFDDVDLILTPTVPVLPPVIADLQEHPEQLRPAEIVMLRNTRPFNVLGLPSISIPSGFSKSGLPIGLQITGPAHEDAVVLRFAHAFQQATDWHQRKPQVSGYAEDFCSTFARYRSTQSSNNFANARVTSPSRVNSRFSM